MRAKLISIGNSKGVRIPKAVIEQYCLGEEVELELEPDGLHVRPVSTARRGWDQAFARMRKAGDDQLLDADTPTTSSWERKEWTW